MVTSYCTRRRNSGNISTYLRRSYHCEYYTTRLFGHNLSVAVTGNSRSVQSWIRKILYLQRHRRNIIVGLGMQWRPVRYNPFPATIQICIGNRILIFQILRSYIPTALFRFLRDRRITFAGYNIGYDCRLLRSYHGIEVTSTVELRSASGMGTSSMERMAERFLGFRGVEKPRLISTSDWDARFLSVDQIQYAALDAYLSFRLGVELVASPASTVGADRKLVSECNMVFAVGAENRGLYADYKFDGDDESDSGSGFEDFERDKADCYSCDSDSTEYARQLSMPGEDFLLPLPCLYNF